MKTKISFGLPRAIVVGRAFVQRYSENAISKHMHRYIAEIKKIKSKHNRQGDLARQLCEQVGHNVNEYNSGELWVLMKCVPLNEFSHPNMVLDIILVVYQTSTPVKYWINLLNLNDHFNPITKLSGFFIHFIGVINATNCYSKQIEA